MAGFIPFLKQQISFIANNLWKVRLEKLPTGQRAVIRTIRIIALAIKGFKKDNSITSATALTFYSIFSIVPVVALVFAIAKGFGFEKSIQEQLMAHETIKNNTTYSDLLNQVFDYASKMLASAKGGVIAGFGILLLLWSVMRLLMSIENSFNEIWKVPFGRSWVRKITDYLTIMIIGPVFLILSGGITVAIESKIGGMAFLGSFSALLIELFAGALVAGLFAFLYGVLPNTKVTFKSAAGAGVLASILVHLLGWAYIRFQIGANSMNAIYGGFAAVPLFFIWVQYNWYVVLFGAQFAYASQFVDHYELEDDIQNLSPRYHKVIALMIASLVARRFHNGEKPMTSLEISKALDLPARLTKNVIHEFLLSGVFVQVTTGKSSEDRVYQPGVPEARFTVKFIMDALETSGINTLPISDSQELTAINHLMVDMDELLKGKFGQMLVKDIVAWRSVSSSYFSF